MHAVRNNRVIREGKILHYLHASARIAIPLHAFPIVGKGTERFNTAILKTVENMLMDKKYTIRLESEADYPKTENLVRESFWNVYRPGCLEHYVLHCLRSDGDFVPELNFVMEMDGELIGQNVFVKAAVRTDSGKTLPVMAMGPICITPSLQRKGLGKILLDYSLDKAKAYGVAAVCFEGNIAFYGKSGFSCASEFGIRYHGLPEGADASFFLCKELTKGYFSGITGEYSTPKVYFVDETEAEMFDAKFPPKTKLRLPGQIF